MGMKSRCNNKNAHAFDDYGGRGISICDEYSHTNTNTDTHTNGGQMYD